MKKISIMILVLVVAMASCKKTPEVNLKYVDVERDLITVGTTTATVQCDYQYIATLKKAYFYYGEGEDEADMNTAEMRVVQNTLYVDLAGLKESTTYSYYYEFHNGFNSMRTAVKTFKTEASPAGVTMPTVVTASVTEITANSAKGGGEVTSDGGGEVIERGICWSTNENPTITGSHLAVGSGIGSYSVVIDSLNPNTNYHVRAYAINEAGIGYGLDRAFTTQLSLPEGAVNGLFTITENGNKVYFSKGNLQYQASTNTWRFAEHQWECVGIDNENASSTYNKWIDLFGLGTSGYNHGAVCYQPWSTDVTDSNYNPYGSLSSCLYDNSGLADWGCNTIVNGGNMQNQWRTLTLSQWHYLLFDRNTASNIRFAYAIINDVKGVIIVPDDWDNSLFNLNANNDQLINFNNNVLSEAQWFDLEQNGAVFLPTGGYRFGTSVIGYGSYGYYWSSSVDSYGIGNVFMDQGFGTTHGNRFEGRSVRLIHDAGPTPAVVVNLPVVSTKEVSDITSNSAMCGGWVTDDGGVVVTEYGLCWNNNGNPTVNDNYVSATGGIENYTASIGGLTANTTYYVRAYATNSAGTSYGLDREFTTLSGGGSGNAPEGAINGLFTINANGDQVYFSQGNLQYQASTNIWCFAENQWDHVGSQNPENGEPGGTVAGSDNNNISSNYGGWIDLFGWGVSGWHSGNTYYHPWDSNNADGFLYGPSGPYDLTGSYANADWGVYNPISNGGNAANQWHTLTQPEWNYVFNTRTTTSGIRYAKATVNNVNGVILLPDDWSSSTYSLNDTNTYNIIFQNNRITASQWSTLEQAGAVFLPTAGYRVGTTVNYIGSNGTYWSASCNSSSGARGVNFYVQNIVTDNQWDRYLGVSVRLVQDANK